MGEDNNDIKDRIYDKSCVCPVCEEKFKFKEIKKGKTIFIEMDLGLRGKFSPIMPDYYYVIICDKCGYASISKTFEKTTNAQIKKIKEKVNKNYKCEKYPDIYDAKTAIDRYKTALNFCYFKDASFSERAYIVQKIAFIYEDINEKSKALEYNKYAHNWYKKAYIDEDFPIMDMEEAQFLYNLAYLSYKTGDKEEAKRSISKVMIRKDLSSTLKEKVEQFIQVLKEENA